MSLRDLDYKKGGILQQVFCLEQQVLRHFQAGCKECIYKGYSSSTSCKGLCIRCGIKYSGKCTGYLCRSTAD